MDDCDALNAKRSSDLRLTPVEELFDPLDDLASGAASSVHDPAITAEEPQQQPTSLPVLEASLRVNIKRKRDAALARKQQRKRGPEIINH